MPHVTVVGGGLAGMAAAWRLAERGCRVTLLEQAPRLGGKAGADKADRTEDGATEHGYHIFPQWYRNVWRFVDELDIRSNFLDATEFLQLRSGAFPSFQRFRNLTSIRCAWENLHSGVLPIPEMFLFLYAALDLMSQPYRYRAPLDQITITGFLRSRFYRTEQVATQFGDLMLKGISVPAYEVSAMTMWNVMRYWFRSPDPMQRILKGNLQDLWIDPFARRLEELGCSVYLRHNVERLDVAQGRIVALRVRTPKGVERCPGESVIMAIPLEGMLHLLDEELYQAAPSLGRLRYLRSRAMAAFDVYCRETIPGIPPTHVNLVGSSYGLSFVDVSQLWSSGGATILNCIASDFTSLAALSEGYAASRLMEDLRRFIPALTPDVVDHTVLQTHDQAPLFMNDAGGWPNRPLARTDVPNLYLAGDYCQSAIDLVSMEGAVSTGLLAAEAVRQDLGLAERVEVLVPPTYSRWPVLVARVLLAPVAAVARLVVLLQKRS